MVFTQRLVSCQGSRQWGCVGLQLLHLPLQLMLFPSARGSGFGPDPAGCPGLQALNASALLAEGAWSLVGRVLGAAASCLLALV